MTGDVPSGRRILLVEDEMVVAMLLEDMLDELGWRVVATAGRTPEALSAIAAHEIDAAILDLNLGGLRSYEVADALAAKGVPFVFSTGYGAMGLKEEYRHCPVLVKPFRSGDLEQALRRLLGGAEA